jgi:hypothetical protein
MRFINFEHEEEELYTPGRVKLGIDNFYVKKINPGFCTVFGDYLQYSNLKLHR